MTISFGSIPQGWRVPLYYVEIDSSKAGFPVNRLPVMLAGHMITSGTYTGRATPNVPVPIQSQAEADAQFGQGSMLGCMFETYFKNNWAQEVWGLPVAEGSTAATKTLTVGTPPTAAGTVHLYVAGRHVQVGISSSDTETTAASAIAAAINAVPSLPVTATSSSGVVTVTVKGKGSYGTDMPIAINYFGAVGGQVMPTGMSVVYANGVAGAGDPDFTTALTNLGETPVEYVCQPFTDSNSMLAWAQEFGFSDTGRWGWIRQLYGHTFSAKKSTYADMLTFGQTAGRNNPLLSVMGIEPESPTPAYEWAAAYTGKAARALSIDPARPLQSLHLEGCMPALTQYRFLISQLNAMSTSGIATQRTYQDGTPVIARETTTYLTNLYGNTDDAYTDVTTPATLAKLFRNQRQAITSKFPRHKLANDGTRFGPGQAIVTPITIKAELVAQYREDEFVGLVEDAANFKKNLIVERDPNDPNRLNVLYPPDLVNALRIFAVLGQFRLQYNRGDTSVI